MCAGERAEALPRSTARRRCRRTRSEDRDLRALRRRNQQSRLRHHRQQPGRLERDRLAAGVRARDHQHARRRNQHDVDRQATFGSAARPRSAAGWRVPPRSSSRPSDAIAGCDPVDGLANTARAWSTSSSVAASIVRSRSSARRRKRVGQREEDATHFFGFLLLERDDVVVDLDGAERLEKEAGAAARAAVHDSGNRRAMFRSNDQHVPSIAIRDDLLLQVLRGVLAAQIRLQRAAQPRALLAQPIPQAPQLRARVVHDLAGRDRSCGGCRRSRARTTPSSPRSAAGSETRRGRAECRRSRLDGSEERREREQVQRLERRPSTPRCVENRVEIRWRAKRDLAATPRKRTVSAVAASAAATRARRPRG